MPIVDIERVHAGEPGSAPSASAAALADALGAVFGSAPGRTWVRLRALPASDYAENGGPPEASAWPVFVTVLLAHWPARDALAQQALQITETVAACLQLAPERVHVQYAPEAAGRQAFGGRLVDCSRRCGLAAAGATRAGSKGAAAFAGVLLA